MVAELLGGVILIENFQSFQNAIADDVYCFIGCANITSESSIVRDSKHTFKNELEVVESDKHSSLLHFGIYCSGQNLGRFPTLDVFLGPSINSFLD